MAVKCIMCFDIISDGPQEKEIQRKLTICGMQYDAVEKKMFVIFTFWGASPFSNTVPEWYGLEKERYCLKFVNNFKKDIKNTQ